MAKHAFEKKNNFASGNTGITCGGMLAKSKWLSWVGHSFQAKGN